MNAFPRVTARAYSQSCRILMRELQAHIEAPRDRLVNGPEGMTRFLLRRPLMSEEYMAVP